MAGFCMPVITEAFILLIMILFTFAHMQSVNNGIDDGCAMCMKSETKKKNFVHL